ncbi:hypothetical protein F4809DRAFT_175107 [Biscogniauxia mediterranea]|nr:hypothetical protein F4809DRAFT_175107 [Biscogniauxia mediterranea]
MASHFQVQKPYVLNTLPRPLDPATGRYVVGEVYGSKPGSRKRKRRTELTVGIDGEAVNIYDVSSARLVTSYPIPPQSRISCPISSIRRRIDGTKDIARYTYAATQESKKYKVTLFKDCVDAAGKTTSSTHSASLASGPPVVCLAPILSATSPTSTTQEELLVVRENGAITSLDLESLTTKWTSSPSALQQDLANDSSKSNFKIEFCRPVPILDVIKGIFKGDSTVFGLSLGSTQSEIEDGEVLILVSSSGPIRQQTRHIHIVGLLQRSIIQLHTLPILPLPEQEKGDSQYHLDARTGSLLELRKRTLATYDLTASIPKIASTIELAGATSFLHLSKTSLLCATDSHVNVYNPVFKSLQDTVEIDLDSQQQSQANEDSIPSSCRLVAYFSPLELAVAIVDSSLVAIQLEAPRKRSTKRRAEGLLIDAIGRGLQTVKRASTVVSREPPEKSVFYNYIPGSIQGDYWKKWTEDEARADSLLNANDIDGLEVLLAEKFGLKINEPQAPNGVEDGNVSKDFISWQWPKARTGYPPVDRRWILYTISRAFQWNDVSPTDSTIPRLTCQLPQSNVIYYLVDAGHLTLSNVKAAFRGRLSTAEQADSFLAEQLITRLADVDPSLKILVAYLSATKLGAIELLLVLRTLMRSFELVQDPRKPLPKLLTEGPAEQAMNGAEETDDSENIVGMELDDLEDEIQKTVSYLSEDAGIRGTGLSVAFAKLGSCPGVSMIKALRSTFKPEEILSLVHLLRVELVKGAWTARYLDHTEFERDAALDAPPDGIIKLLADLLGRCVDSIGPGGWLLNDAILAGDDSGDFVASLKLEVSAALEGIEEAAYLRGIVGEAVRFCETSTAVAKKATGDAAEDKAEKIKPIPLHVREPAAEALPLGLRPASERIAAHKVVSGGEVVARTQRETGHLVSQQVGAYSLERIAV